MWTLIWEVSAGPGEENLGKTQFWDKGSFWTLTQPRIPMPYFIFHQAVDFQRVMEGRLVSLFGRQIFSADKFEGGKKREVAEKETAHQHQMVSMLLTSWHLINDFCHWPSAQLNQKHSYNFILHPSKSAPKHHPGNSQGQSPNITKHRQEKSIRELEKIQASTIYPIGNLQSWGEIAWEENRISCNLLLIMPSLSF